MSSMCRLLPCHQMAMAWCSRWPTGASWLGSSLWSLCSRGPCFLLAISQEMAILERWLLSNLAAPAWRGEIAVYLVLQPEKLDLINNL